MSRNAAGAYSLPLSSVVTLTPITSTWANTTMADLAAEMQDSLSRSGKGGMLDTLALADGALGTGGFCFASELTTGFYRQAAGDVRFALGGTDLFKLTSGGLGVLSGTLAAAAANSTLSLKGNRSAADAGTDVQIGSLATRTNGYLLDILNNATTTYRFGPTGVVYFGGTFATLSVLTANTKFLILGNRDAADTGTDVEVDTAATRTNGNLFRWLNNAVQKARVDFSGKGFFAGLDAGSAVISNVATPAAGTDGANKNYVDGAVSALAEEFFTTADVTTATTEGFLPNFSVTNGDSYEFTLKFSASSTVATQVMTIQMDDGSGAAFPAMTSFSLQLVGGSTPAIVNDNQANPAALTGVTVTTTVRHYVLSGTLRAAGTGTVGFGFFRVGGSGNITVFRGAHLMLTRFD